MHVPTEVLLRVWRGFHPERSGSVLYVPDGFNYVDGGISHSTPWPYTQDVPMLWYGPGFIRSQGPVSRAVTLADVAPTLARLLGFPFDAPDGTPMDEALLPAAPPPKLVVVLVWDAGGRYVLDLHPDRWPHTQRLAPQGTWYEHASVGSSPSSTAPAHATIGTGAFPRRHGIMDNFMRWPDGAISDPWSRGPEGLLPPTVADRYGAEMGAKALIGTFATLSWHLGMMSHGAQFPGGGRHVAVLRNDLDMCVLDGSGRDLDSHTHDTGKGARAAKWGLPRQVAEFYRFPDYVNDLPPLSAYRDVADAADGRRDGRWRGHSIEELRGGFDTPARYPYQGRAIREVIEREGFGHHEATDLVFLNYKLIDEIGHLYSASSPEMGDAIAGQDAALPRFIRYLNRQVGRGKWVLLVTADHGHTAAPAVSGGVPIQVDRIDRQLDGAFHVPDRSPISAKTRPTWLFPNDVERYVAGVTLVQIAGFVQRLTRAETAGGPMVSSTRREDPTMLAAFPGSVLLGLPGIPRS